MIDMVTRMFSGLGDLPPGPVADIAATPRLQLAGKLPLADSPGKSMRSSRVWLRPMLASLMPSHRMLLSWYSGAMLQWLQARILPILLISDSRISSMQADEAAKPEHAD